MLIATAAYLQVIGHDLGKIAKPAWRCKHLQHSSRVRIVHSNFALWGHLRGNAVSGNHSKSRIALTSSWAASPRQPCLGFWISGQQNDEDMNPFNDAGYALAIPLKESYPIKTRNSFPPEDVQTTMWSTATCSPNLELSGKSDSGSRIRWLRILFEKSLARLQMSHKGSFGKWLIRWSIETVSALARTTSSGATSLTSAALEKRSPKSPGSTADSTDGSGTAGSSRSSGGVSTRKSSAECSTAAGTPGITSKLDWKKGAFWETLGA